MELFKSKNVKITSLYGNRPELGDFHTGVDCTANGGFDYIVACEDGVVTNTGYDSPGYGYFVHIDHKNGLSSLYAHMKEGSITVKRGDIIKKGTIIGYMGNTGNSFGAHLHFEIREWNKHINPLPYIQDQVFIFPKVEEPVIKEETPQISTKEEDSVIILDTTETLENEVQDEEIESVKENTFLRIIFELIKDIIRRIFKCKK